MKVREGWTSVLQAVALLAGAAGSIAAFAQGTAFTYQGRLNDNGVAANGSYDLRFILYTADIGGSQAGPVLTNSAVAVNNGLFTTTLDFGADSFPAAPRFLEIGVRSNGSGAGFRLLSPRQPLTPTPYAITAGNVSGGGLMGIYSNAVTFNNAANSFTGNGAGLTSVNAATLGGLTAGAFWQLGGNAGTTPGVNFLGTTDNQALELKVNNQRTLRLEPGYATLIPGTDIMYSNAPNVIAGSSVNVAGPGVFGSVIGGGGVGGVYQNNTFVASLPNEVSARLATISGGYGNTIQTNADLSTIAGGYANTIETSGATIGGGLNNTIETNAPGATIGGGAGNWIQTGASGATIGGGAENTIEIDAYYATIGGGYGNHAGGPYATVPGGSQNHAFGSYSFAAGQRARASHNGAFVWADSERFEFFNSTAANQFLIRASGGVGIGTASPVTQLTVGGAGGYDSLTAAAITLHNTTAARRWEWHALDNGKMQLADFTLAATRLVIDTAGNVGIGTASPAFQLQLSADSAAKPTGGSWSDSSDTRIKKNIQPLTGALDKLTQLRGVSFEWINPADHANQTGRQAGFVAQEVERVFPNWVQEVPGAEHDASLTPNGRIKSLSLPFEFDALTVEALRELRAEKDAQVKKLASENAELKQRLEKLERLLNDRFTRAAR